MPKAEKLVHLYITSENDNVQKHDHYEKQFGGLLCYNIQPLKKPKKIRKTVKFIRLLSLPWFISLLCFFVVHI